MKLKSIVGSRRLFTLSILLPLTVGLAGIPQVVGGSGDSTIIWDPHADPYVDTSGKAPFAGANCPKVDYRTITIARTAPDFARVSLNLADLEDPCLGADPSHQSYTHLMRFNTPAADNGHLLMSYRDDEPRPSAFLVLSDDEPTRVNVYQLIPTWDPGNDTISVQVPLAAAQLPWTDITFDSEMNLCKPSLCPPGYVTLYADRAPNLGTVNFP